MSSSDDPPRSWVEDTVESSRTFGGMDSASGPIVGLPFPTMEKTPSSFSVVVVVATPPPPPSSSSSSPSSIVFSMPPQPNQTTADRPRRVTVPTIPNDDDVEKDPPAMLSSSAASRGMQNGMILTSSSTATTGPIVLFFAVCGTPFFYSMFCDVGLRDRREYIGESPTGPISRRSERTPHLLPLSLPQPKPKPSANQYVRYFLITSTALCNDLHRRIPGPPLHRPNRGILLPLRGQFVYRRGSRHPRQEQTALSILLQRARALPPRPVHIRAGERNPGRIGTDFRRMG